MKSRTEEITRELKARESKLNLLLTAAQYELLRLRGNSQALVEEFETLLRTEIALENRKDPFFIPNLWVQYRVEGYAPSEIQYDWVHATR